jgi:alpha-tubulin suppressor-like RCC1 family protein
LWIWGVNEVLQYEKGRSLNEKIPIKFGDSNEWQSVTSGFLSIVALKKDGTLWSWGLNFFGESVNGFYPAKIKPTQIGYENNWESISGGVNGGSIIAIKNDGSLWGLGENHIGQLGDETVLLKNYPVRIGTSLNWQFVSRGEFSSLGIKKDGTLWYWGKDGIENFISSNRPTQNIAIKPTQILTNDCVFPQTKPITIETINYYPNPSSGLINIKGIDLINADITVYNILGETIKNTQANNNAINISELPSGSYMLSILTANKVRYVKMIVKI